MLPIQLAILHVKKHIGSLSFLGIMLPIQHGDFLFIYFAFLMLKCLTPTTPLTLHKSIEDYLIALTQKQSGNGFNKHCVCTVDIKGPP